MSLEEAKNRQKDYLKYLNIVRKGNKNPRKTLSNIENYFNARNSAIKFIEDYGSMILEAKRLAKESQEDEGFKLLIPNQMLKRLPVALAQVKAGNNSESLLNEIRLFILCIDQKKLLKKYTIT